MRAIISVWDKTGVVDLARELVGLGAEVFSTGGTKKSLEAAGIPVKGIAELTGFPEILDGRVKTLHPAVHGGILARRDLPQHMEELSRNHIQTIDLVAVNLYPFLETISRPGVTLEEALENIDIGGPTLLRAAAKNFPHVLVLVDPADYAPLVEKLRRGEVSLEERRRLAAKAFQHVACYDTAISQYLRGEGDFPEELTIALRKHLSLRYGENPHQQAVLYEEVGPGWGITSAKQLWGKELSFNNFLDADAAWAVVSEFTEPTVAVIKHTNPCGLASHPDVAEAYRRALSGDPVSAFGGIVAANRRLTAEAAREIVKTFYEIVLAPGFAPEALEVLKAKRDLRLLDVSELRETPASALDFRRISGGFLVQTRDSFPVERLSMRTVTRREPSQEELRDLLFAWQAVKHVKSNAIVLAKDKTLLGMGAGQPSRVQSVEIALKKAGERSRGSVLASDAMFPFPDGVEMAAQGGVTAIIQPGGSVRDKEVIEVADRYGMAMVFTGVRHFKH